MKMKTVNRGKLTRDIAAGKLEARCVYHYTDDYAFDAGNNDGRTEWTPCRMQGDRYEVHPEGMITFTPWELRAQGGRAYMDEDVQMPVITLRIHSNLVFSLRYK